MEKMTANNRRALDLWLKEHNMTEAQLKKELKMATPLIILLRHMNENEYRIVEK